jgi:hypothetical protein
MNTTQNLPNSPCSADGCNSAHTTQEHINILENELAFTRAALKTLTPPPRKHFMIAGGESFDITREVRRYMRELREDAIRRVVTQDDDGIPRLSDKPAANYLIRDALGLPRQGVSPKLGDA